jgi:hypothetical protein
VDVPGSMEHELIPSAPPARVWAALTQSRTNSAAWFSTLAKYVASACIGP